MSTALYSKASTSVYRPDAGNTRPVGLQHIFRGRCNASTKQTPISTDSIAINIAEPATYLQPPQPVPVVHSSAYLRQRQAPSESTLQTHTQQEDSSSEDAEEFTGNALEWALKKVDATLDNIEQNPPVLQKKIYDISMGPVGQATSKGVRAAAQLTVTATVEAAKIAAPVGKWALQEGFKATVKLVNYAMEQERKQKKDK